MKKNASRPLTFLGVGILNTLLDFFVYTVLALIVFPDKNDIWIVGIVSGAAAMVFAYTTHQLITWRDHPASKKTIVRFVVFTGLGLWLLRPVLLLWFVQFTALYDLIYTFIKPAGLSYNFVVSTSAFGLMILIVMTYNFIAYDKFVFTRKSRTDLEND